MIADCDLLIGREIISGMRQSPDQLADRLTQAPIDGGAVASLRALQFDVRTGNDEAAVAAQRYGWWPVYGIDLRDPLGAEQEMDRAADQGVRLLRLAPGRQQIAGTAPRLRILVRRATELGMTLLVEGSTVDVGAAMLGLGASVVFLDQHFYDLGEFILLARDEPGFHLSTRLLGSPGAWELLLEHAGPERLLLGTRAGWFEEYAVLDQLEASPLTPEERELVVGGNLRRLAGRSS
ncbi:Predicted metal-dependent hydrolase, TIM-barrel fold [Ruania alba]|uniref:Predicted metal-dependent hydrolase, TIM-barrel fold n=2 Tax=Ruania alba TaxID=648782 RepID=A0A1H5L4U7_9MICO|nr:Predicted metal-dependent hydrolase, TIM-barrel fold [Ruania alba]